MARWITFRRFERDVAHLYQDPPKPRSDDEVFTADMVELNALAEKVYAVVPGLDEEQCRDRLGRLAGEAPQRRPILDIPDISFW